MQQNIIFPSGTVKYLFDSSISSLSQLSRERQMIIVTDSNVAACFPEITDRYPHIILPAGENTKTLSIIEEAAKQLLAFKATRNSLIVGVGGGVVTDITGYLASVYMRGVPCGFVPATLLGMVDAAIGGKNGVNIGLHKNIIGTITQPEFILYDYHFLTTLPDTEWSNGFAEIIKCACLFDEDLFHTLSVNSISYYQKNPAALSNLVEKCAVWKNIAVVEDERETGSRKLLNFGHTAAHAIEKLYELPHGQAVAIGMVIAAALSEQVLGFSLSDTQRLKQTLRNYKLPISYAINVSNAMELLKMDKKRNKEHIDYILLEKIGKASVIPLSFETIEKAITICAL